MDEILGRSGAVFLLVLIRAAGVAGLAPFFGARAVPLKIRFGLALALALAIFPVLPNAVEAPARNIDWASAGWDGFLVAAAAEAAAGLAFGLAAALFFAAFDLAGHLIGQQMGLSFASVVDPFTEAETPLIQQLLGFLAVIVFLAVDGHHAAVRALAGTFQIVPPGAAALGPAVWADLSAKFGRMLLLGLQIAAPAAGALFLVTIGFGLLARSVPRLDVWGLSFPVQTVAGLALVVALLPLLAASVEGIPDRLADELTELAGALAR